MTPQEIDRIQNAIRHIKSSVDIDPWAMELAVEALEKQLPSAQADSKELSFTHKALDTISRQAAIDTIFSEPLYESGMKKRDADAVVPAIYEKIKSLPSARQDVPDTNVGDTISRQAAIDALSTPHGILYPIRTIEALPSAQQWIPCSERMPERGKDVLVTRDYDGREDNNKSCRYVEVASCYGEDDDITWSSFSDEYKIKPRNHHVVAWMPLPEPYKGGGKDGSD
jgi:hypothetical protein